MEAFASLATLARSEAGDDVVRQAAVRVTRLVFEAARQPENRPTRRRAAWTAKGPAGGGVAAAYAAGEEFKLEVWSGAEVHTTEEAAARVGISRAAMHKRVKQGQALALEVGRRGLKLPRWQFDEGVAAHMPVTLSALGDLSSWAKYLFLTRPSPLLGGRVPREVLASAGSDDVLRAARILAAEEA